MLAFITLFFNLLANPVTGDNSGTLLTILFVAGGLCVVAVAALLIVPKLSKKDASEESEIEEIHEDE